MKLSQSPYTESVGNNESHCFYGLLLGLNQKHWLYISEFSVYGLWDLPKYWDGFLGIYKWLAPPFSFLLSSEGDSHLACLYAFASLTCPLEIYMVCLCVIQIISKIDDILAHQDSLYSTWERCLRITKVPYTLTPHPISDPSIQEGNVLWNSLIGLKKGDFHDRPPPPPPPPETHQT